MISTFTPVSLASTPGAASVAVTPVGVDTVSSTAWGLGGGVVPSWKSRDVVGGLAETVTGRTSGWSGEPVGGSTETVQLSGAFPIPRGTLLKL